MRKSQIIKQDKHIDFYFMWKKLEGWKSMDEWYYTIINDNYKGLFHNR